MKRTVFSILVMVLALMAASTGYARTSRRGSSSTLAKAEKKVMRLAKVNADRVDWFEKNAAALEQFEKIIKGNSQSLSYGFERIKKSGLVDIEQSADGNFRLYQWDTGGGTMSCYCVWQQYRKPDGNVVTERLGTGSDEEFDCCGLNDVIGQLRAPSGEMVYLVKSNFRIDGFQAVASVRAVKVGSKGAQLVKFTREGDARESMGVEFSDVPGWYFKTCEQGYDWLMAYDEKSQDIYVSLSDELPFQGMNDVLQLTDRYDIYHFDGNEFVYKRTGAGYWLHSSLDNYKNLEVIGIDLEAIGISPDLVRIVRIDRMNDGSYRYAAWTDANHMSVEPTTVINGGTWNETEKAYVFKDGASSVVVEMNDDGDGIKNIRISSN